MSDMYHPRFFKCNMYQQVPSEAYDVIHLSCAYKVIQSTVYTYSSFMLLSVSNFSPAVSSLLMFYQYSLAHKIFTVLSSFVVLFLGDVPFFYFHFLIYILLGFGWYVVILLDYFLCCVLFVLSVELFAIVILLFLFPRTFIHHSLILLWILSYHCVITFP